MSTVLYWQQIRAKLEKEVNQFCYKQFFLIRAEKVFHSIETGKRGEANISHINVIDIKQYKADNV